MSWIFFDVIVSVFWCLELSDKSVGNSILPPCVSEPSSSGKWRSLTCKPSDELSVPPVSDLMYGSCEDGCTQVFFKANIAEQVCVVGSGLIANRRGWGHDAAKIRGQRRTC